MSWPEAIFASILAVCLTLVLVIWLIGRAMKP